MNSTVRAGILNLQTQVWLDANSNGINDKVKETSITDQQTKHPLLIPAGFERNQCLSLVNH